jgi:hypothetical protein
MDYDDVFVAEMSHVVKQGHRGGRVAVSKGQSTWPKAMS